jgi:pimeloyl-ACP methyl ester carboxylesterase
LEKSFKRSDERFIQTTFKTSDGVKLSYLRAGNGLPVILLHGFLASGEYFKSQAQILSEQYNVIVLDHRSHRESEKVPFGLKISRVIKKFDEAFNNGDAAALAALYTEDAVQVTPQGPVFGREAIEKLFAGMVFWSLARNQHEDARR